MRLATQSCDRCGLPVVPVTAHNRRVYLDPAVPLYMHERDPDGDLTFWVDPGTTLDGQRWVLAQHICKGEG